MFVGTNALLCVMVLSLAMWIAHRIKKVTHRRRIELQWRHSNQRRTLSAICSARCMPHSLRVAACGLAWTPQAQISWLSDSGAAMLLGVFIGAIVNLFGQCTCVRSSNGCCSATNRINQMADACPRLCDSLCGRVP